MLIHLCYKCKHNDSHKIIPVHKIIPTNTIENKINEGYNLINNYCSEIKNDKIQSLVHQINQIEYSYQIFQNNNVDILQLSQLILNNYHNNSHNYYYMCNIINLNKSPINLYKYYGEKIK